MAQPRFGHASDLHTLVAGAFAADDPHRTPRHAEDSREEIDERIVSGAADRRGGEADDERAVARAGEFGLLRARDDAHVQDDGHYLGAGYVCMKPWRSTRQNERTPLSPSAHR